MINRQLVEASLFGYDTFADVANYTSSPALPKLPTGNAVDRGWVPLTLPGLDSPGVDLADVGVLVGQPAGTFTSAAHFYAGELEGLNTLVITYRSTDEPNEFGFQGLEIAPGVRAWDLYFSAHQDATVAALTYAATPSNGIEQVLFAGHSLGGIIAELSVARLVDDGAPFAGLADRTLLVTLGSPGSTETVQGVEQLNVVHTDDFVAQLSALSPLFIDGGAAREGVDLAVERPEVQLPDFKPTDLDTPEELIAASQIPGIGNEHPIVVYIDTASLLESAESFVPGVRDAQDDPFRWLNADVDETIIATDQGEIIRGGNGDQLIFALGGNDIVFGDKGNDVLVAQSGLNQLNGGKGNDTLVDGSDNDILLGDKGNDLFFMAGGLNIVNGGSGTDKAIFDGAADEFSVFGLGSTAFVSRVGDPSERTIVQSIERLEFDDQTLALERGKFVPVDPEPAAVASMQLDDLVVAGDVA
jgi:hypothetical protein